jgi:hypothetical protein
VSGEAPRACGPGRWIGVAQKPFGLEQMPVTDLVERDRPLSGQREMLLAGFANIGVAFHHDESSRRLGAEIAKTQAVNGRKPERTAVHDKRNRRGVRTTVGTRGSKHAIRMSVEKRRELLAIERIRFGPSITKTGCGQLIARVLDRKQFVNIHQMRIGRSTLGQDVTFYRRGLGTPVSGSRRLT